MTDKFMKYSDVSNELNKIVLEYLNNGYSFWPYKMGGTQGELAKIDLYNPNERRFVRLWIRDEDVHSTRLFNLTGWKESLSILEQSCDMNMDDACSRAIFWFSRSESKRIRSYYKHGSIFISEQYEDEIASVYKKAALRSENKYEFSFEDLTTSKIMRECALKMIRRRKGCSRKKDSDIVSISKFKAGPYDRVPYRYVIEFFKKGIQTVSIHISPDCNYTTER